VLVSIGQVFAGIDVGFAEEQPAQRAFDIFERAALGPDLGSRDIVALGLLLNRPDQYRNTFVLTVRHPLLGRIWMKLPEDLYPVSDDRRSRGTVTRRHPPRQVASRRRQRLTGVKPAGNS